jgi:2-(1,2-epoxy-1,2-dihydrophenyl)acetyl-CoA isomerase
MSETSETSEYEQIRYAVDRGVARLTLHRPERRNAMTNRMVGETYRALCTAVDDSSIRVLLLTGTGTSFCPGADITAVADGTVADEAVGPESFQIPALLHEMAAITVAVVNGPCAGAAFGWAAGCDLRIAARSARFNTAFLDVGVAGDMALPWSLPRLVGMSKAMQLMLLPDKFDAEEAHRIGLVASVHDADEIAAAGEALVARLMAMSPPALRTCKQNFLDAATLGYGAFAQLEATRHLDLFKLHDTREAFAAKAEKRAPRFTGT